MPARTLPCVVFAPALRNAATAHEHHIENQSSAPPTRRDVPSPRATYLALHGQQLHVVFRALWTTLIFSATRSNEDSGPCVSGRCASPSWSKLKRVHDFLKHNQSSIPSLSSWSKQKRLYWQQCTHLAK